MECLPYISLVTVFSPFRTIKCPKICFFNYKSVKFVLYIVYFCNSLFCLSGVQVQSMTDPQLSTDHCLENFTSGNQH